MDFSRAASGRRGALVALLCGVALLVVAPAAFAVEEDGAIAGTVTKVGGIEMLEGIEVCAYEASAEPMPPFHEHCVETHPGGAYTIPALPSGRYDVEFAAPFESALDYVTQYYRDSSTLAGAQAVAVSAGETTSEIDAEMREGGEIEGVVTEATAPHGGLANIEVEVFEASGPEFPVGFATTNASGEYAVKQLAPGSYRVEFSTGFESELDYITQYYDGASSLAGATLVTVTEGATKSEIDARLQRGGEISGTVTDASTHAAVANVEVLALGSNEVDGVAFTNASGQYTIVGLATGLYKVAFADSHYITQYYDDEPSLVSANPVSVIQENVTGGIVAALVPKAPVDTAAPVASGTPAAGQTLSCTQGSWTGSPAPTYAYAWLRDGVAIAGASASTYVIQTADVGNGLTCKVTATNKNGSAAAVSNTLIVPVPAAVPPTPVLTVASSKIVVSGGSARVSIACATASCIGAIELSEPRAVQRRAHGKAMSKVQTLVLGRGSYALAAGHRATVVVHLTAAGRRALARARHRKLSVELVATVAGGKTVSKSVALVQAPPARRGNGKHR